ncbi:hypothetical protein QRO08_15945 [Paracidovorax citrulli]|uniref:Lipoprotein n=1 Tax=Paracidovorax citrulli TaxID=80869 RepID=A0ABY9AK56_PARCI|nr:hypothetical protein [Paracidovorax citrulli]PVY66546.1 hypothetical protein C8E08_3955 [Paracidovorax citrulli]REG69285.1 hypothetical protein C8E07_2432 [Paracidovorax citrulli]RLJ93840.1 hypothetical protein C8E06_2432 [Paracidovorax citrulli]UMT83994.1 hypothetical protein FRC75_11800 [Paracidovorax citrulli]WIY32357.1 hypothetical protein QRO09_11820 [Paracidovorax citrulli]
MRRYLALAAMFIGCTANAAPLPKINEAELRKEFTSLKDPDSAKFRNIKLAKTDTAGAWVMCGEVNAKNSYGGYAGFGRFMGMLFTEGRKTTYLVMTIDNDSANVMCEKHGL